MLEDGLYTRFPRPDFALAMHVLHELPTGTVGYTSGPAMAGSTAVDVIVRGRGGHGAAPHRAVDPIVLAALVVLDFQTIVSREIDPIAAGGRDRRLDPRGDEAQHHLRRGQAAVEPAGLSARTSASD